MSKFRNILFPVDFSERSTAAAPFVLSLAQRHKAKVTLINAVQPAPPIYGAMNTIYPDTIDYEEIRTILLARLREFAEKELPKVDTYCVEEVGDPATVVTDYAEANDVDLIAMPTHGYGAFRRMLLGSVTAKVLHDAKVPVWTAAHAPEPSHRAHPSPRHIVVALDLSAESRDTMAVALELAQETGADLEILHVAHEGEVEPSAANHADRLVHEVVETAAREQLVKVQKDEPGTADVILTGGSIAEQVRAMAVRKRADLVVIGRGSIQSGLAGRLKSNSYSIIREAPCPVLSV